MAKKKVSGRQKAQIHARAIKREKRRNTIQAVIAFLVCLVLINSLSMLQASSDAPLNETVFLVLLMVLVVIGMFFPITCLQKSKQLGNRLEAYCKEHSLDVSKI